MLFSEQTEREIAFNTGPAAYGSLIMLTAHAYNELLTAARNYKAMTSGSSSAWHHSLDLGGARVVMEEKPDGAVEFRGFKDAP